MNVLVRRETLDMLKEAIRYSESAIVRAARVTRQMPAKRPGHYSVVEPREPRDAKGK